MTPLVILVAALGGHGADAAESFEPRESTSLSAAALQDAAAEEGPKWTGSFNFGVNFTQGNSDTLAAAANFDAERRSEKDRYSVNAFWNFAQQTEEDTTGSDDTDVTQRNTGAGGQYDYFVNEKLYYLGNVSAKTDDIARLDLQYILGAGAGYQFREDEKLKLSGELGLVFISEEFEAGDNPTTDPAFDNEYIAARAAYNLDWQASETTQVTQTTELFPSLEDSDDFNAKIDSRVNVNMTESMIGTLQWVVDFDHTPASGAKQADHRVIVGVGWTF